MSLPPLQPEQRIKPPGFELRISLIYAAIFASLGIHLPYFPLWLEAEGFSAEHIGVILAAPMFVRVITTPVISAMADRAKDRANMLVAVSLASVAFSFGYFLPATYGVVLTVSVLLAIVWAPQVPLTDSLALSGVRRFRSSYTAMRIWGSLAFLVASIAGGAILSVSGALAIPAMISAGLVLASVAAFFAPRLGPPRRPAGVAGAAVLASSPRLFGSYFILFVAGTGVINASHGFMFGFVSIYWKDIALSDTTIGALWAWAVVAEVATFLVFNRLLGRVSASTVMTIAGFAAILRWLAYPLIEPAGLGVAGFFGVQSLHALSTGLLLIGLQKMIGETVPEERTGAAQGVAFFAVGFSMGVVTLASGPLYQWLGIKGFYVMAIVAALGLALIAAASFSQRAQPHKSGVGGDTIDPS